LSANRTARDYGKFYDMLNDLEAAAWDALKAADVMLNFRHRAYCILGQAFHFSPENAFYIFNQQIYFII